MAFRIAAVVLFAEGVDTLFSTRFFFIPARPTKRRIKAVLVQRLLQTLGFHHIGMSGAAMTERANAHIDPFLIDMHQQLPAQVFNPLVAKGNHLTKLPCGIHMHEREWRFGWMKIGSA